MGNSIVEESVYDILSIESSDEILTVINTSNIYTYYGRIGSTIIWIESLFHNDNK